MKKERSPMQTHYIALCMLALMLLARPVSAGDDQAPAEVKVEMQAPVEVKLETVRYQSVNEKVLGVVARPAAGGPWPGVIVIHEWWGLNDWIREVAEKIAGQGYVVLAVDLYRGQVATDAESAHELMRGVPEDRAARDLQTASEYLRSLKDVDGDRIASVGWCMGGSYSLEAAVVVPDLAACVVCYGRLMTEDETISNLGAPILGIYGAEDGGIPAESVRKFEKQARELGRDVTMHLYPDAGHAFMNHYNKKGYNAEATADAWEKILAFLDARLKPAPEE
jgi:carboxymethylenebutenolidase